MKFVLINIILIFCFISSINASNSADKEVTITELYKVPGQHIANEPFFDLESTSEDETAAPSSDSVVRVTCRSGTIIFLDENYVDSRESGNLLHSTIELLHGAMPTTIDVWTQGMLESGMLDGYANFVMPELERASLASVLSAGDKQAIRDFTNSGGTFIISGANQRRDEYDVELLNEIFGYSLQHDGRKCKGGDKNGHTHAEMTSFAANTAFSHLSSYLPHSNAVYCLKDNKMPADSITVFDDEKDSVWVATFGQYQSIVFIGFDWTRNENIQSWVDILDAALNSSQLFCEEVSSVPSTTPTSIPTNVVTAQPSLTPTTQPSQLPSAQPSHAPSAVPSVTLVPTGYPTIECPEECCREPSYAPTYLPTVIPTLSNCPNPPINYSTPSQYEIDLLFDSLDSNHDDELSLEELEVMFNNEDCACCEP